MLWFLDKRRKTYHKEKKNLFDTTWISNIKWYYILISGLLAWTELQQHTSCLMLIYLLGIYLISLGFFPTLLLWLLSILSPRFCCCCLMLYQDISKQEEIFRVISYYVPGRTLISPTNAVSQLGFRNKSNGSVSRFHSPPLERFQDISMLPFSSHCEHHSEPCIESTRLYLKQDSWSAIQKLYEPFFGVNNCI